MRKSEWLNNVLIQIEQFLQIAFKNKEINIIYANALIPALIYEGMKQENKALSCFLFKIVDDALTKFSGTSEEGQIKLFKASLLAKSDHVPDGLAILETFDSKSPLFSKARKVAAKIYLNVLKDKASYIKCFRQLVEVAPNKTLYLV